MADNFTPPQQPDFIPPIGPRNSGKPAAGGSAFDKFRALPKQVQLIVAGVLFIVVFLVFGGGSSSNAPQGPQGAVNTTSADAARRDSEGDGKGGVFTGLETDRPALFQNWLEQNRREMSDLKDSIEKRFQERDQAMSEGLQRSAELQREMRQMMTDFTAELRNIQSSNARDREVLGQLAEEQKKIQLNAPTDGSTGPAPVSGGKRERINQTPLGSAPSGGAAPLAGSDRAFLAPIARVANNGLDSIDGDDDEKARPKPFIPPLGFIKGTMLNGVDALVGGTPTPALVRLSGSYKTAMNSSVKLDGCFILIEFQGEVSTERAVGKPSRMTCVYPDQGAVTYGVSGYVVDAEDGIIGIPGVFYEGDASRIAAAMLADFAAGVGQIVAENQTTQQTTALGGNTTTLTGSEAKAQVAGGVDKAMSSLRDYLMERVNRVLPFVRLDATREMHIVLLSGTELRSQGNAWTLLFDAEAADGAMVDAASAEQGGVQ